MKYNPKYHSRSFLPKMILGRLNFLLSGLPHKTGDLLVLNYHSTPLWLMPEFERQLRFLSEHYELVSPDHLESFYGGTAAALKKPAVVFTFDDGLKNNLHAAAMLEKFGVRGLFLVVPDFFTGQPGSQETYYRTNIRREVNDEVDRLPEDKTAMSESDLKELLQRGHLIGCHSMTHTMSRDDDREKQYREVIESKAFLEKMFSREIVHFCAPFNSLRSTGREQMKLIAENYRYFHSTFPGSNLTEKDPLFIKRVNVEVFWPLDAVRFAISGPEWNRWKPSRNEFRVLRSDIG